MEKHRGKVKISSIIPIFYALFAFWSLNPYFTWNTYLGGVFGKIYNFPIRSVFALLAILFSMFFFTKTKKINTNMMKPAVLMFVVVFIMLVLCGGENNNPFDTAWLSYIAIIILLLLPIDVQKKSFNLFSILFTISLIIPLIIFLVTEILKVDIPYSILYPQEIYKQKIGVFYKHRFFSIQIAGNTKGFLRFNGIYYEAGMVGTICALLLSVYKFDIFGKGKWKQKILLIAGACSMTLSFIMFTALFMIIKNINELKIKNVFKIILVLLIYFIFVSINFSNPMLKYIQSRVIVEDYTLQGDNRSDKKYDKYYKQFYNSDAKYILLGYGRDAFENIQNKYDFDGSSYKSIIYDYGYIRFFTLFILVLICFNTYI